MVFPRFASRECTITGSPDHLPLGCAGSGTGSHGSRGTGSVMRLAPWRSRERSADVAGFCLAWKNHRNLGRPSKGKSWKIIGLIGGILKFRLPLFPTCQVRVVRFYVSCRSSSSSPPSPPCLLPDLNHDHPRPVFAAGLQPRPATPSVRCRTSTTTIHAQCSLPDLNHDHPRPVFAAGLQPRPATPSVRCRTSTTTIHAHLDGLGCC